MSSVDLHIDSLLPNLSIGQTNGAAHDPAVAGTKHTHAKAGGGTFSHTHAASAERAHGHDAGASQAVNPTGKDLLPTKPAGGDDSKPFAEAMVACPTCHGSGNMPDDSECADCGGDAKVTPAQAAKLAEGDDSMVKCPTCDGSGKILGGNMTCPDCKGKKEVPADQIKDGKFIKAAEPDDGGKANIHQHAVAGGGTMEHSHKIVHVSHSHMASDDPDNDTDSELMPLAPSAASAMAELDTDARNALPDKSFAFVDDKGEGHLPIHDKGHVSAAMSRFGQTDFPDAATKKQAARKILSAASKKGVDVGDDNPLKGVVAAAELTENEARAYGTAIGFAERGEPLDEAALAELGERFELGDKWASYDADRSASKGGASTWKHGDTGSERESEKDIPKILAHQDQYYNAKESAQVNKANQQSAREIAKMYGKPVEPPVFVGKGGTKTTEQLRAHLISAHGFDKAAVQDAEHPTSKYGNPSKGRAGLHVAHGEAHSSMDFAESANGYQRIAASEGAEREATGQLIALDFGEDSMRIPMGEHELPYLIEGDWTFPPDTGIGRLHVGMEELDSVVKHFQENARGQDLPVCDLDHHDPAYRGAAVGWVTDLVRREDADGRQRVNAIVDFNDVGEDLRANDRFRYVSPTLLRNWEDPAKGIVYPMIAAGVDVRTRGFTFGADGELVQTDTSAMALTNKPRLKQLGRIAASEGGTEAIVLAVGRQVTDETNPAKVAKLWMADDPDGDGDDDGPVPCCVNAPNQGGDCIAFTRWPGDTDGDGTCLLATRGCNAYQGVTSNPPLPVDVGNGSGLTILPVNSSFSEGGRRVADNQTGVTAHEETPPAATAPTAVADPPASVTPPVATPPAVDTATATLAERASADARVEAAEQRAKAAEDKADLALAEQGRERMARKVSSVTDRIGRLRRTGRITNHQFDLLSEASNIVKLAESPDEGEFTLAAFEAAPAFSIAGVDPKTGKGIGFSEIGSAESPDLGRQDEVRVRERMKEIFNEKRAAGQPIQMSEAGKLARREVQTAARMGA